MTNIASIRGQPEISLVTKERAKAFSAKTLACNKAGLIEVGQHNDFFPRMLCRQIPNPDIAFSFFHYPVANFTTELRLASQL